MISINLDLVKIIKSKPDLWDLTIVVNKDINSFECDHKRLEYISSMQAVSEAFRQLKPYLDLCEEKVRKQILTPNTSLEIIKDHQEEDTWLSVKELSQKLGISKSTIYNWIRTRSIPYHKKPGSSLVKFLKAEVFDWFKKGRISTNSEIRAKAIRELQN